ncbi:MAG: multicopper oxidase domain-containing protein, partial [Aquincola sp.]|nr:multicopper oxidase domain-containing protein [Aquincola sp.]
GLTRLNVYAGLASHLFLRDAYDLGVGNTLGLPSGDCELPLTLQDKAVDMFSGKYQYMPALLGKNSWLPGMFGDLSLVNGAAFPKMTVDRGVYRFRILNEANSRPYALTMSNGAKFHVIGNDQGMLNAPVPTTSLEVLPGERYDVLIDFSNAWAGSSVVVYNTAIPPNAGFIFGSFTEVMRFDVRATLGRFRTLPTRLRGGVGQRAALPSASSIVPVRQRTVTLAQVIDIACGTNSVPLQLRLNNLRFEQEADTMAVGQWELWNVVNTTLESHPFHIHLAEMRILNRQKMNMAAYLLAHPIPPVATYWAPPVDGFTSAAATAPAAWEAGRKDTVNVTAEAVTRILVRLPTAEEAGFDPRASFTNVEGQRLSGYMYHCHLLEHEDCDMMRPMQLV